ncbi:MAG: thioredoxin-like domain-containing protein [Polaribacter sp.]|nr:thioredoxin-like domain-containing protein [Polaribacter sp.]
MKKIFLLLFLLSVGIQAQYKIKGTLNSSETYTWVILYKIEGTKQIFVKNATINSLSNSTVKQFEFELPKETEIGAYRISYTNDDIEFVDFLFNKEAVSFSFDPKSAEETIVFTASEENILYQEYRKKITTAQQKIDSLQLSYLKNPSITTAKLYLSQTKEIALLQKAYVQKGTGKLAQNFIIASYKYNSPKIAKTPQEYLSAIIQHYFDVIDLNNPVLYNSAFLINRVTDYVFYMNYSEDVETQKNLYQKSVATVLEQIKNISFKTDILEYLITQFVNFKNVTFVDYLFETYYDTLPKNSQNIDFKKRALEKISVEIGRIAPEITWTENKKNYKLSTINEVRNYVLIFWSTTCFHCLKEIPELNAFTQDKKHTKVIAFGMEEHEKGWKKHILKLKGWHHILGLGKWENPTASAYQIYSTPTYIVLDSSKRIIAKPETLEELKKIIRYLE